MVEAEPGDSVLSYADAWISHVGRVTARATEGSKPTDYGPAGENWNNIGWHLPVEWTRLPQPVQPKKLIDEIAPLLPLRYSPFSVKAKRGNEGAYLSEISEALFRYIIERGGAANWAAQTRRSRR